MKVLSTILSGFLVTSWASNVTLTGQDFIDFFNVMDETDPTGGFVDYVDETEALSLGLLTVLNDGTVFMGADNTSVASSGRKSVRIESKTQYTGGLFILDLAHMPEGCGTWPAFWSYGPSWPDSGEIDVIEGVNLQSVVQTTLHTSDGCDMEGYDDFTGTWVDGSDGTPSNDCYIDAAGQYSNAGCGISGAANTMGAGFNDAGGGVYAMYWQSASAIRTWFFPHDAVPDDITEGQPLPESWGTPYAAFVLGDNCSPDHFKDHYVTFDLTLCGDWAGSVWSYDSTCVSLDSSCEDYVANHPEGFDKAYWLINSLSIYDDITSGSDDDSTSGSDDDCVETYSQCGGDGYEGPTTCCEGLTCVVSNEWWSGCQ